MFENDAESTRVVSNMLLGFEKNGLDAVRKYSVLFDNWNPGGIHVRLRTNGHHSDTSYDEIIKSVESGFSHITHI